MVAKKYDKLEKDLVNLISSGSLHTTLIGKIVSVDHSDAEDDVKAIKEFAEYVVNLVMKADKYGKDNVKTA
jgi:hypothetical protein